VDLAARERLVIRINERFQDVAVAGVGETKGVDESIIDNEVASPFWTWFIENPRPTARTQFRQA
jgi:hypothetical protein